jgi:protein-L-isoaspartate(D-aspartate) O-methyltransferase
MTDLLDTRPEHRVLEIGTGCGYQSAVLAALVEHLYSVEIVPQLAASAKSRLERLGISNVSILAGDGYHGWPEFAPYDGVIVTAATRSVPAPLLRQLRNHGKLVIPLGDPPFAQELTVIKKEGDDKTSTHRILPVAFVPFTRQHGKKS